MKTGCLFVITMFLACLAHTQDKPGPAIPQTLLNLADAYIEKPGEQKQDLDTAFLLIAQARKANTKHDPHIEGRCLLLIAKASREKGDLATAKTAAFEALALFGKEKTVDLAEAEFEAARYYNYQDPTQNRHRIALYRDAAPIFEKADRRLQQARTLELLGDCLQYDDYSVPEALPPLLEAFHIYTTLHETDLRNISTLLASTYSRMGDQHSALLYGLLAIKLEEARPEPTMSLFTSYNRIGLVYYNINDFPRADTALGRATNIARRFRDTGAIKEAMLNRILIKIKLGQPDSALLLAQDLARNYPFITPFDQLQLQQRFLRIYVATGNFGSAKPIVRRFLAVADTLGPTNFAWEYIDPALIEYALAIKDYPLARKFALRYRSFTIQNHHPLSLYKTYYQLYLADSAQGRFKSAINNYQQYVRLRDSLQSKTDSNQLLALQAAAGARSAVGPAAPRSDTTSKPTRPAASNTTWQGLVILGVSLGIIGTLLALGRYRSGRRNRQLEAEKEWLVKELHHRVKNNLQIVMSLLNTQSHYLDNEKAQAAISQSRNRMYALSLIHQRLYHPDNLEQIDMKRYVPDLVQHLRDSFPDQRHIVFHLDIAPQPLDVAIAVPVGLILNEAISNALQWAFPARRHGEVHILMTQQNELYLGIADDGIGLAPDHESQRQYSMGIQLMETLVQQLDGSITITGDNGTRISIRLPLTSAE